MNLYTIMRYEEGLRLVPYLCSEDYVTVGIGTKLCDVKGADPTQFPTITETQAIIWYDRDMAFIHTKLWNGMFGDIFRKLCSERQDIIMSMCYQMGVSGVCMFRNMWSALEQGLYESAAAEMLDSKWARQTPKRALRHAQVMGSGTFDAYNHIK